LAAKFIFGGMLGFTVSCIGFADYDQVHAMFSLNDFRMLIAFALATALGFGYFHFFARTSKIRKYKFHPGIVPGSVLFGTGWALTGGCPAVILTQLGHGHMPALVTFFGISLGVVTYRRIHAKFFRWDRGSCQ